MIYENQKKELINAYTHLLIVQYHDKPKAIETIKLLVETSLADMLIWQVRDLCLNIDKSVGVQLDQIGKWVGVDRFISKGRFEGKMWYAYIDWNDESEPNELQGGLQDWDDEDFDTDGPFLGYEHLISDRRQLNDDTFRVLIKLKIIKNEIMHSPKYIDDAIHELFEDDSVYVEWGTCMEMTYKYQSTKAGIIEVALEKHCLPCPSGVNLKLEEI